MTAKAVVLISGSGSNLQAIINAVKENELPLLIECVISNKADAFGLQRAQDAGIPTACISHRDFDSRDDFDAAIAEQIERHQPDIIILAGFMRILTSEFVERFQNKIINVHPSLLPKYMGINTHQRALDAGDKLHGASIHFVEAEVDTGPVIIQGQIKIKQNDDATTLQQRIHKVEHVIYPLAIKWIAQKRLTVINGKVLLDGEHSIKQLQSFDF